MNKSEEEIYNEIIDRIEDIKSGNDYLLTVYKGDEEKCKNSPLYNKEYTYLDFLDGRKNLITIDNYCKHTGQKIDKNKIKKELSSYFNIGLERINNLINNK